MKHDKANDIYRKLTYFYKNQIKVHFKDLDKTFYNGLLLDLNETKKTLVIQERVRGAMPILLEFIDPNSIVKMKEDRGGE